MLQNLVYKLCTEIEVLRIFLLQTSDLACDAQSIFLKPQQGTCSFKCVTNDSMFHVFGFITLKLLRIKWFIHLW